MPLVSNANFLSSKHLSMLLTITFAYIYNLDWNLRGLVSTILQPGWVREENTEAKICFSLLYKEVQKTVLPTFTFPWGFIYLILPLAQQGRLGTGDKCDTAYYNQRKANQALWNKRWAWTFCYSFLCLSCLTLYFWESFIYKWLIVSKVSL